MRRVLVVLMVITLLVLLMVITSVVFATHALANPACNSVLTSDTDLTDDLNCLGFGITKDNPSTATIRGNNILGNLEGGIGEVGSSALVSEISRNTILGNGGFDLDLGSTDDTVARTICETSDAADLCPSELPRFHFDKGKKK